MSLWGVHVGIAGIVTTLVLARTRLPRARRWAITVTSGVWAVVPDLYHFVPGTRAWYKPLLHDSAWANLFWLHRTIDRLDPRDRPGYSVAVFAVFLAVVLADEWRRGRSVQ